MTLVQYYPLLYLLDREPGVLYALTPLLSLLFLIPALLLYKVGLRNYQGTGS